MAQFTREYAYAVIERRSKYPVPQPGPQTDFYNSDVDVVFYGGAAGGGKTYGLLMLPLKYVHVPGFSAVVFRRTTPQIRNPGGLWDESLRMYGPLGVESVSGPLEHRFPGSGAVVKFSHLELPEDVTNYDGAQICMLCYDQLESFDKSQFDYLFSRNRSTCGVRPVIRATCNPQPGWLADFLAFYIDQSTGLPIPEHAGKVRWFIREGDSVRWADTREELLCPDLPVEHPEQKRPKSFAFFPAKVTDNRILMERDPGYLANLNALSVVPRGRLLDGNWLIEPEAGLMFRREWCETVDTLPADIERVTYWDRAATAKTASNDPDWSVSIQLGRSRSTRCFYLIRAIRMRSSAHVVEAAIRNTALADGPESRVGIPQDPGAAGKAQAEETIRNNPEFSITARIESGDKVVRFSPFSAQAEAGCVKILRGFSEECLRSLEGFPDAKHDDDADAVSGAYQMFVGVRGMGLFEYFREQYEAHQRAEADGSITTTAPDSFPFQPRREEM